MPITIRESSNDVKLTRLPSNPANHEPANHETVIESLFDFVSYLVHDLESPLASMRYALELMSSGNFDPEREVHQRLLRSAHIAATRAETLVSDILAVSRSENASLDPRMARVNLFEIAREAVELAQASGAEHGVSILLETGSIKPEELVVNADPHLLSRILDNFIYNAIRHTPFRGSATVGFKTEQDYLTVFVLDTGEGLKDVDSSLLFEKFGQVEMRKSKKHRGVGLGLFFCRLAAEAMDAKVFAENSNDSGARFGITFPR